LIERQITGKKKPQFQATIRRDKSVDSARGGDLKHKVIEWNIRSMDGISKNNNIGGFFKRISPVLSLLRHAPETLGFGTSITNATRKKYRGCFYRTAFEQI
jgi:hypothetical protein